MRKLVSILNSSFWCQLRDDATSKVLRDHSSRFLKEQFTYVFK